MEKRLLVLSMLASAALAAGATYYLTRSPYHGRPGRPMIPPTVADPGAPVNAYLDSVRDAEREKDPLQRCLRTPLPATWKWSAELLGAFCADYTTPRASSSFVWNNIGRKKTDLVDAYFEELTDNYYAGRVPEGKYWFDFYNKFTYSNSGTTEAIDAWLAQQPGSAHAWTASALHHEAIAFGYRGGEYAARIPQANRERMRAEVLLAAKAARRAVGLDARSLPAHSVLVRLAKIGGDHAEAAQAYEAGLRQRPDSYYLRLARMETQVPRWGGSQQSLDAIAREAQRYLADNPRLAALESEARANRAFEACREDGPCDTAHLYYEAFENAPAWTHFDWAGSTLYDNDLWLQYVDLLTQQLRFEPGSTDSRRARAAALVQLKQNDWALAEYERLLADDGDNASLLRSYAWALRRMNRFKDAEAPMLRLVAAEPHDRDAQRELARLYLYRLRRIDDAKPVIDTLLQANPADGAAWLLKADYLQNKNAPAAEIRAAAQQFVDHADAADDEQAKALPKVKAWLAKG